MTKSYVDLPMMAGTYDGFHVEAPSTYLLGVSAHPMAIDPNSSLARRLRLEFLLFDQAVELLAVRLSEKVEEAPRSITMASALLDGVARISGTKSPLIAHPQIAAALADARLVAMAAVVGPPAKAGRKQPPLSTLPHAERRLIELNQAIAALADRVQQLETRLQIGAAA